LKRKNGRKREKGKKREKEEKVGKKEEKIGKKEEKGGKRIKGRKKTKGRLKVLWNIIQYTTLSSLKLNVKDAHWHCIHLLGLSSIESIVQTVEDGVPVHGAVGVQERRKLVLSPELVWLVPELV